jgi:hypothetical protein
VITGKQVLDRAIELFKSSLAWPVEGIDEVIRVTYARKHELNELDCLAFQSTNFAIKCCSPSDGWPPMSPQTFAERALTGMSATFPKFVKTVREGK